MASIPRSNLTWVRVESGIRQRLNTDGSTVYEVRVRRKGMPERTLTCPTLRQARKQRDPCVARALPLRSALGWPRWGDGEAPARSGLESPTLAERPQARQTPRSCIAGDAFACGGPSSRCLSRLPAASRGDASCSGPPTPWRIIAKQLGSFAPPFSP